MKTAKQYYQSYIADTIIADLNLYLTGLIMAENPVHVFEFGCGSGKNLWLLDKGTISTCGMDISVMNVLNALLKFNQKFVICGDETYLRNIVNFDIVFTCSVLDHIPVIDGIIQELKRIANKKVFLAEANGEREDYYYSHDYSFFGFSKLEKEFISEDGFTYYIWEWEKK